MIPFPSSPGLKSEFQTITSSMKIQPFTDALVSPSMEEVTKTDIASIQNPTVNKTSSRDVSRSSTFSDDHVANVRAKN